MIVSSRIQFIYAYGQKWGKILKEKVGSNAKILWLWTDDAEAYKVKESELGILYR
jgi:hypothetical protein